MDTAFSREALVTVAGTLFVLGIVVLLITIWLEGR